MACVGGLIPPEPLRVSLKLMRARLECCRACPAATRNTAPEFAAARGLTSRSYCTDVGPQALIVRGVRRKDLKCPRGKW